MQRIVKNTITTFAMTTVALAAISGRRAQSADTDLRPAIQEMRDEIRELRRDIKGLRALLEKREVAAPAPVKAKPEQLGGSGPNGQRTVAYFFYAKWCGPCQQMMPIIDRLRAEGHPIVKADVDSDKELQQRFNIKAIPALWIELAAPEFIPLQGIQTEETIRSSLRGNAFRPAPGPVGAGSPASSSAAARPVDEKLRQALQRTVTFDCDKLPLQGFIDHIWKDWHLGNVVVPMTVDRQASITMHVYEATLESVLKQGFEQAHVRYEFGDGVLLLSPVESLVLLVYPVADLLTNLESLSGLNRTEKTDFLSLETLIRTATEPKSWEESGGAGLIRHNEKTLSLVIRQTMPVHAQIRDLLQELRKPQQLNIKLRTALLDEPGIEVLKAAGIDQHSVPGRTATSLTKGQSDRLLKISAGGSALVRFPTVTAAVGKETLIRPFPGEHVWPESVQAISGQVGGRAYLWFELTGNDPTTGQAYREGAISLSPDFKPVLIPLKTAPEANKSQEWPLRPTHTVDDWAKAPKRRFLLIMPEVEIRETLKEQEESR
jgi:thioredoxin 1